MRERAKPCSGEGASQAWLAVSLGDSATSVLTALLHVGKSTQPSSGKEQIPPARSCRLHLRDVVSSRSDADPRAVDLCPAGSGGEDAAPRSEPGSCPKSVWPGGFFTLLKLSTETGLLEQSQRGKPGHKNPVKMHVFQAVCWLTEPGRCCAGFSPPLPANALAPGNAATSFVPALQEELALHKV